MVSIWTTVVPVDTIWTTITSLQNHKTISSSNPHWHHSPTSASYWQAHPLLYSHYLQLLWTRWLLSHLWWRSSRWRSRAWTWRWRRSCCRSQCRPPWCRERDSAQTAARGRVLKLCILHASTGAHWNANWIHWSPPHTQMRACRQVCSQSSYSHSLPPGKYIL